LGDTKEIHLMLIVGLIEPSRTSVALDAAN